MKQKLMWGEVPEIAEAMFIWEGIEHELGETKIRVVPVPTMGLGGLSQSMQITRSLGSPAHIPEEIA